MQNHNLRYQKTLRAIAFFTLLSYVCNQAAWAVPETAASFARAGEIKPAAAAAIPPELGTITQAISEKPSLFIIPDAHGQYEAQKTVESLLDFLKKDRNLGALFIEGGAGKLDAGRLAFFQEEALNLKIADALMREAEIGGAERFALRHRDVTAYGIEDLPLYLRNIQRYQDVLSQKNLTGPWLEKALLSVWSRASRDFSKQLFDFFKVWNGYEEEKIELAAYLEALERQALETLSLDLQDVRAQLEWPTLVRFFELKKRGALLDEKKSQEQKQKLAFWAEEKQLPPGFQKMLFSEDDPGPDFDRRAFWENFYSAASPNGFRFEDYPDFFVREGFLILEKEMEAHALMTEIGLLRDLILEKLAVSQDEKKTIAQFRAYLLLKKIFSLSVTPEEYLELQKTGQSGILFEFPEKIKKVYAQAMEFYKMAFDRDEVFARAISSIPLESGKTAAVIAGGFHTEGLCRLLRKKKISYAVIMPRISSIETGGKYTEAMTGKIRRLDFGASSVRVPQWMMDQAPFKDLQDSRARLRKEIFSFGESRGGIRAFPPAKSELRIHPRTGDELWVGGKVYVLRGRLPVGGLADTFTASTQDAPDKVIVIKTYPGNGAIVTFSDEGWKRVSDLERRILERSQRGGENKRAPKALGPDAEDVRKSSAAYYYVAMQKMEGVPLDTWLDGRPAVQEKIKAIKEMIEAVRALHEQEDGTPRNIVHRDLKPQNFVRAADGTVSVIDFNMSQLDDELTGLPIGANPETDFLGTLSYISWDIFSGPYRPLTSKADIFSLGLIFVEMMTGVHNNENSALDNAGVSPQALLHRIPFNSRDEYAPFVPLVSSMLQTNPENRPSARELLTFFETAEAAPAALSELRMSREKADGYLLKKIMIAVNETERGYVLSKLIGISRKNAVYVARAEDKISPDIVVKMTLTETYGNNSFVHRSVSHEAAAMRAAGDTSVPAVYDVQLGDKYSLIAMEYGGPSLTRLMQKKLIKNMNQRVWLAKKTVDAVRSFNSSVLNLDLKPDNILYLSQSPSGPRVKVTDFGMAQIGEEPAPGKSNEGRGTPPYMAPEMFKRGSGPYSKATEVYVLGATLFEILTEQQLFTAESDYEYWTLHGRPLTRAELEERLPAEIRGKLGPLLRKMLEVDEKDRYQDVDAVFSDFRERMPEAFPDDKPGVKPKISTKKIQFIGKKIELKKQDSQIYTLARPMRKTFDGETFHASTPSIDYSDAEVTVFTTSAVSNPEALKSKVERYAKILETAADSNGFAPEFYGVETDSGKGFSAISTEYMTGYPLKQWMRGKSDKEKKAMAVHILRAVAALHKAETPIAHLNLDLSRFLIDFSGKIKVIGFEIAQFGRESAPFSDFRSSYENPQYMAPEMFGPGNGPYDLSADVYMLAETLFELAAGRPRISAQDKTDYEALHRKPVTEAELREGLPEGWKELAPVFKKAFEINPAARHAGANELLDEFTEKMPYVEIPQEPNNYLKKTVKINGKRYRILSLSGKGTTAWIFKAEKLIKNKPSGEYAAAKVFRSVLWDKTSRNELNAMKEYHKSGKKHVPEVEGLGLIEEDVHHLPVLVKEYLEGKDLDEWKKAQKDPRVIFDMAVRVVEAAASIKGVVHQDLKPRNIIVTADGPKITDFGSAKFGKKLGRIQRTLAGTPQFAAPEMLSGEGAVTPRVDVYSIGVIFYDLISGSNIFTPLPWGVSTNDPGYIRSLKDEKKSPPNINDIEKFLRLSGNESKAWIISKAMQPDPSKRFANADEMLAALRTASRSELRVTDPYLDQVINAGGFNYRIAEWVGGGETASVYEGVRLDGSGLHVAIKIFVPGMYEHLIQNEIKAMKEFKKGGSEHAVEFYGDGEITRSHSYHKELEHHRLIVTGIVRGDTLEKWKINNPKRPDLALSLLRPMLTAAAAMHESGVIHLDLRPGNWMRYFEDNADPFKIIDLTLAKYKGEEEYGKPVTRRYGTAPMYAGPELWKEGHGSFLPSSDVYSLGVLLYWLATGTHLLSNESSILRNQKLNSEVSLKEIEKGLREAGAENWLPFAPIIYKAMRRVQGRRYRDAVEMLAAVDKIYNAIPMVIQVNPPKEEKAKAVPAPVVPFPVSDGSANLTEARSEARVVPAIRSLKDAANVLLPLFETSPYRVLLNQVIQYEEDMSAVPPGLLQRIKTNLWESRETYLEPLRGEIEAAVLGRDRLEEKLDAYEQAFAFFKDVFDAQEIRSEVRVENPFTQDGEKIFAPNADMMKKILSGRDSAYQAVLKKISFDPKSRDLLTPARKIEFFEKLIDELGGDTAFKKLREAYKLAGFSENADGYLEPLRAFTELLRFTGSAILKDTNLAADEDFEMSVTELILKSLQNEDAARFLMPLINPSPEIFEKSIRAAFDFYLFYHLALLATRVWENPKKNYSVLSGLLKEFWTGEGASGRIFAADPAWLVILLTSQASMNEADYLRVEHAGIKVFPNFSKFSAKATGRHLRTVFERLDLENKKEMTAARRRNAADYAMLVPSLNDLWKKYEAVKARPVDDPEKQEIVEALLGGISGDAEAFSNPTILRELKKWAEGQGGKHEGSSLRLLSTAQLDQYSRYLKANRKDLAEDVEAMKQLRPVADEYNPLGASELYTSIQMMNYVLNVLMDPSIGNWTLDASMTALREGKAVQEWAALQKQMDRIVRFSAFHFTHTMDKAYPIYPFNPEKARKFFKEFQKHFSRAEVRVEAETFVGKTFKIGDTEYRIKDSLPEGGFGWVMYAETISKKPAQTAAVKIYDKALFETGRLRTFIDRSIAAMKKMQAASPGWLPEFYGETLISAEGQEWPALVMEYLPGFPLNDWMVRGKSPMQRREAALEILRGLAAMQEQGILHRDLKAENIQVQQSGNHAYVKFLDFDFARIDETGKPASDEDGRVDGSPSYMALDLFNLGSLLAYSQDLYSFGVLAYSLATQRNLFNREDRTPSLSESKMWIKEKSNPPDARQIESLLITGPMREAWEPLTDVIAGALSGKYPDAKTMLKEWEKRTAYRSEARTVWHADVNGSRYDVVQHDLKIMVAENVSASPRRIAFKPSRDIKARDHEAWFLEEMNKDAALKPYVPAFYAVTTGVAGKGEIFDSSWIAMEHLDGQDFDKWLKVKGRTRAQKLDKFEEMLRVLSVFHSKGIVHMDVKPQNIFILKDGSIKIIDFEGAQWPVKNKLPEKNLTAFDFYPPGAWYSDPVTQQTPAADVFSLGVTLAFLARDRYDMSGTYGSFRNYLAEAPPTAKYGAMLSQLRNLLPRGWKKYAEIILKAGSLKPEDRYENASEMLAAVRAARSEVRAEKPSQKPEKRKTDPKDVKLDLSGLQNELIMTLYMDYPIVRPVFWAFWSVRFLIRVLIWPFRKIMALISKQLDQKEEIPVLSEPQKKSKPAAAVYEPAAADLEAQKVREAAEKRQREEERKRLVDQLLADFHRELETGELAGIKPGIRGAALAKNRDAAKAGAGFKEIIQLSITRLRTAHKLTGEELVPFYAARDEAIEKFKTEYAEAAKQKAEDREKRKAEAAEKMTIRLVRAAEEARLAEEARAAVELEREEKQRMEKISLELLGKFEDLILKKLLGYAFTLGELNQIESHPFVVEYLAALNAAELPETVKQPLRADLNITVGKMALEKWKAIDEKTFGEFTADRKNKKLNADVLGFWEQFRTEGVYHWYLAKQIAKSVGPQEKKETRASRYKRLIFSRAIVQGAAEARKNNLLPLALEIAETGSGVRPIDDKDAHADLSDRWSPYIAAERAQALLALELYDQALAFASVRLELDPSDKIMLKVKAEASAALNSRSEVRTRLHEVPDIEARQWLEYFLQEKNPYQSVEEAWKILSADLAAMIVNDSKLKSESFFYFVGQGIAAYFEEQGWHGPYAFVPEMASWPTTYASEYYLKAEKALRFLSWPLMDSYQRLDFDASNIVSLVTHLRRNGTHFAGDRMLDQELLIESIRGFFVQLLSKRKEKNWTEALPVRPGYTGQVPQVTREMIMLWVTALAMDVSIYDTDINLEGGIPAGGEFKKGGEGSIPEFFEMIFEDLLPEGQMSELYEFIAEALSKTDQEWEAMGFIAPSKFRMEDGRSAWLYLKKAGEKNELPFSGLIYNFFLASPSMLQEQRRIYKVVAGPPFSPKESYFEKYGELPLTQLTQMLFLFWPRLPRFFVLRTALRKKMSEASINDLRRLYERVRFLELLKLAKPLGWLRQGKGYNDHLVFELRGSAADPEKVFKWSDEDFRTKTGWMREIVDNRMKDRVRFERPSAQDHARVYEILADLPQPRSESRTIKYPSQALAEYWPAGNPVSTITKAYEASASLDEDTLRSIIRRALEAFANYAVTNLSLPDGTAIEGKPYKNGNYSFILRLLMNGVPSQYMIELPRSFDERAQVIGQNNANFAYYHRIGRTRFLPRAFAAFKSAHPQEHAISVHEFFEGMDELNFGFGKLRYWDFDKKDNPFVPFSDSDAADILAEMIAIIVYHYEPFVGGGTTISNVGVNRGDFIKRRQSGPLDMKLITVRARTYNVDIPRLIHSLIQFQAAEEMVTDNEKVFPSPTDPYVAILPVLISNPSIVFHGIVRGLKYLYKDTGVTNPEQKAEEDAKSWILQFRNSEFGKPYQQWVDEFLNGRLPLTFGQDPGEAKAPKRLFEKLLENLEAKKISQPADALEIEERIRYVRERFKQVYPETASTGRTLDLDKITKILDSFAVISKNGADRTRKIEKFGASLQYVKGEFRPMDVKNALVDAGVSPLPSGGEMGRMAGQLNDAFPSRSEVRSIDSDEEERMRRMSEPKTAALTAQGYQTLSIHSRAFSGTTFSSIFEAWKTAEQVSGQALSIEQKKVIHELIFNMLDHAYGGAIGFKIIQQEKPAFEITAWDNGYGIEDPEAVRLRSLNRRAGGSGFRALSIVGSFVEIMTGSGIWRRNGDGAFEQIATVLNYFPGTRITVRIPARSELRYTGDSRTLSKLAVAEKTTNRIFGRNLRPQFLKELLDILVPPVSAAPKTFMKEAEKQALAEGYAKLFKSGASAVLPASLILALPENARIPYLDLIEQGFNQSGVPFRKAVYFAGDGAGELAGFLKRRNESSGIFEIVRQDKTAAASRRSKEDISVSVTAAPANIKDIYHLPAFLIDPAVFNGMDAASKMKYLHGLTQLQLLAASQLKRALGDVVHGKEYAKKMGEFLRKTGIEYATSQAGLVTPAVQSLLSETLTNYLRTRELTAASA